MFNVHTHFQCASFTMSSVVGVHFLARQFVLYFLYFFFFFGYCVLDSFVKSIQALTSQAIRLISQSYTKGHSLAQPVYH